MNTIIIMSIHGCSSFWTKILEESEVFELMRHAIEQAGFCGIDVPVGAVIVKGGEIISSGFNQRESCCDPLGHAELIAIKNAALKLGCWRLTGCSMVTTLEPCPMCAEAIIQARMEELVFGAYDPNAGAVGSVFNLFANRKALPSPRVISGILQDECASLLKDFFRRRRQETESQR